jgi:pantothenate synthetase
MTPQVESIVAVRESVAQARRKGLSISLVPTMGALHAGHARPGEKPGSWWSLFL